MISVELNDKTLTNKPLIKDLHHHRRVGNFVEHNNTPEGYLTGVEFVNECKSFVTDYYIKNGLL